MNWKRRRGFRRHWILEKMFDRRIGGTAHFPSLSASPFQLAVPVLFRHLEHTHAGTVRAFLRALSAQHRVHQSPRFFPDGPCPGTIAVAVPFVCFLLVLVLFGHMLRNRHIPRAVTLPPMQRHPLPVPKVKPGRNQGGAGVDRDPHAVGGEPEAESCGICGRNTDTEI